MDDGLPQAHLDEIVDKLTAGASDGAFTTEQLLSALGEIDITGDIERLLDMLKERGVAWRDPGDCERPVFPPDYRGPTLVKPADG